MCQHSSREYPALIRVPNRDPKNSVHYFCKASTSSILAWLLPCALSTKEVPENEENTPFSVTYPRRKELSISTVYPGQSWLSGSIFTLRWLSLCHTNLSGLSAGKGGRQIQVSVRCLDSRNKAQQRQSRCSSTPLTWAAR